MKFEGSGSKGTQVIERKRSVTDGQTDGRTDRRTDGQGKNKNIFISYLCRNFRRSIYVILNQVLYVITGHTARTLLELSLSGEKKLITARNRSPEVSPRLGNAVYARPPLMVPPTAPKVLIYTKYCERQGAGNLPLRQSSPLIQQLTVKVWQNYSKTVLPLMLRDLL